MTQQLVQQYPLQTVCNLVDLPRSSYYYWRDQSLINQQQQIEADASLVAEIERISLKRIRYGYRRITRQLKREGFKINGQFANHKKVLRLMRENDLLCEIKKSFVATTDSDHLHKKYSNLLKKENIKITKMNQVWVSDISYVRLADENFVYVAVVIDACSRAVIGYSISEHIDKDLVLEALKMAIKNRDITDAKNKLIHHSDQGVQYACTDYTNMLTTHGIRISMSHKGAPWENGIAESFFKTLKYDEVYLNEYLDIYQAKTEVFKFITTVYNTDRLHSSIGYMTPAEFEKKASITNRQTADRKCTG